MRSTQPGRQTSALLLRTATAETRLLYGTVSATRAHAKGYVVLLPAEQICLYSLRATRLRTFVFRTLRTDEALSTRVPGVAPPVRLLVQTETRGRQRKLWGLFVYLKAQAVPPSSLSDGFYSRIHALLAGRLPKAKVLRSLLAQERGLAVCPPIVARSRAGCGHTCCGSSARAPSHQLHRERSSRDLLDLSRSDDSSR